VARTDQEGASLQVRKPSLLHDRAVASAFSKLNRTETVAPKILLELFFGYLDDVRQRMDKWVSETAEAGRLGAEWTGAWVYD